MGYDEDLATRVRGALDGHPVSERKMFGGLCFMVRGHMAVGIVGDELMVRVGPAAHGAALKRPHARPMDFTGRPLDGFVYVAAAGLRTAKDLRAWVARGADFVATLPAKQQAPARARPRPRPAKRARAR